MIDLDLALARGGFRLAFSTHLPAATTGIFGPSGAGKSSLLHALAGLLPTDRLRLAIDGEVVVDTTAGLAPPAHRRRIGLVFQDHRLFPHLSVRGNLAYGQRPGGPTWDEVISLLDLGELLDRRPDQCSGGQRQRIALGRALLAAPRLLLLDEPLANLDQALKRQILPYLRAVRDRFGLPLMMVSHDLEDLLSVTDELLLIDQGRLVGQGALEALAVDPALLPRLHASGLVTPLPGVVVSVTAGHARVRLDGPAGAELLCVATETAPGARVDVLLRPDDLLLALPPVDDALSVSNRLPGTITRITRTPERCLVHIEAGAVRPLLAELAGSAVDRLALAPGQEVLVLAKAQAVQAVEG